eukprot:scaffold2202_cov136-Isochrysis_galbana.AAC.9
MAEWLWLPSRNASTSACCHGVGVTTLPHPLIGQEEVKACGRSVPQTQQSDDAKERASLEKLGAIAFGEPVAPRHGASPRVCVERLHGERAVRLSEPEPVPRIPLTSTTLRADVRVVGTTTPCPLAQTHATCEGNSPRRGEGPTRRPESTSTKANAAGLSARRLARRVA